MTEEFEAIVERFNEFLVRLRTDLPITDEDSELLKQVNLEIDKILKENGNN